MHRFRITERPCAQLQDSGAPEDYRRKEPFEKKGAITMEGSPRKTREGDCAPPPPLYAARRFRGAWRGDAVFSRSDGGKRLSR